MAQSVTTMLKDGQEYMKTWPLKRELYTLFPDCRVVAATRFAVRFMPPVAVLACATMLNTFGTDYLPQALAVGAFFLSMPMQGLLWLGKRSNQTLPPQLILNSRVCRANQVEMRHPVGWQVFKKAHLTLKLQVVKSFLKNLSLLRLSLMKRSHSSLNQQICLIGSMKLLQM